MRWWWSTQLDRISTTGLYSYSNNGCSFSSMNTATDPSQYGLTPGFNDCVTTGNSMSDTKWQLGNLSASRSARSATNTPSSRIPQASFVRRCGIFASNNEYNLESCWAGGCWAGGCWDGGCWAGMEVAGMEVAGMEVTGLEVAGMEVAGMEVAGMEVAWMEWVYCDENIKFRISVGSSIRWSKRALATLTKDVGSRCPEGGNTNNFSISAKVSGLCAFCQGMWTAKMNSVKFDKILYRFPY